MKGMNLEQIIRAASITHIEERVGSPSLMLRIMIARSRLSRGHDVTLLLRLASYTGWLLESWKVEPRPTDCSIDIGFEKVDIAWAREDDHKWQTLLEQFERENQRLKELQNGNLNSECN